MANKTCTGCKQTKPVSDFYQSKYNGDENGYDYYCKYCRNGSHLKSLRNNKKRCSLDDCDNPHYAKTYCRKHHARLLRHGGTDRKTTITSPIQEVNPSAYKNKVDRLKLTYKMDINDFFRRSKNGCEICGNKPEANLHVDHDHACCPGFKSCGACVRGVICNSCNMAVDKMEEGIMRPDYPKYDLIKEYLEAYSGKKG